MNAQTLLHYHIIKKLGAGGMGEVYLAQDTTLRRPVAIKILPAHFTTDQDRLNRFEREAQAVSALNHPNILTIYEIGTENGVNFIATEFIDGESLRRRIANKRIEFREILEIGIQVASALAAAHAAGIIHRDIKPENIMVRRDGFAKVLDFGLAKLVGQEKPAIDMEAETKALTSTAPDVVVGTVSYMSPEQARGLPVDVRSDVWSLGVVLYEMVAGRTPFADETKSDVIAGILKTEPASLTRYVPDVPAELERIVTKALRKDREERYQTVKELGLDLKSLKQRLEFEAELERTGTTQRVSEAKRAAAAATSSGHSITETKRIAAAQTDDTDSASGDIHTTSSAEYIVHELKQHKRGIVFLLATLLVAIIGLSYFFYFSRSSRTAITSVAVLPFVNESNDASTEYLSDGISESLINNLSQLPQLKVIARSSTFKYKGKEVDVQEVAKALGVEAIVTGRIVERGDNLQISVEMVDARDGRQVWGAQYNRTASDLQAAQEEMARTISEKLRLKLTGAQEQQLMKRATENAQAYQLYLNGLFHRSKGGVESARKALDYFNQAIARDPNFALAYAGISEVYNYLGGGSALDPKEATPKAKAAALKALALDETLAEGHAALASIKQNEWDWMGAENEYQRVIELNPNLASAHASYASYLATMGRTAEALAEIKRAQELDPLSTNFRTREDAVLYFARRYDESIRHLQNVIKSEPGNLFAHNFLGYIYASKGMFAEAINEYQKLISIDGETTSTQIFLGYAYAMSGKRDEARALLGKLKTTESYVSPAELSILYAGLGDKEAAFQSLERAYTAHDLQLQYLKVDPHYDSLRSDARFADIIRRVGLTP